MTGFKDRIIRAAKLDIRLYEEVEADKGALGQAMGVVVLSSIAAGLGSIEIGGIGGILTGTVTAPAIQWVDISMAQMRLAKFRMASVLCNRRALSMWLQEPMWKTSIFSVKQ